TSVGRPSSRSVASATPRFPCSIARWKTDLGCPCAVTGPLHVGLGPDGKSESTALGGCSGGSDRTADDERVAQVGVERLVLRIREHCKAVQRLREEAARGRREHDVHDLVVREAELAQTLA